MAKRQGIGNAAGVIRMTPAANYPAKKCNKTGKSIPPPHTTPLQPPHPLAPPTAPPFPPTPQERQTAQRQRPNHQPQHRQTSGRRPIRRRRTPPRCRPPAIRITPHFPRRLRIRRCIAAGVRRRGRLRRQRRFAIARFSIPRIRRRGRRRRGFPLPPIRFLHPAFQLLRRRQRLQPQRHPPRAIHPMLVNPVDPHQRGVNIVSFGAAPRTDPKSALPPIGAP